MSIRKGETGHPLQHRMTTAIPTSQCMICHMHQPNLFMNTMLGYTMWDYETGAPQMWPKKQRYPTDTEVRAALERISAFDFLIEPPLAMPMERSL